MQKRNVCKISWRFISLYDGGYSQHFFLLQFVDGNLISLAFEIFTEKKYVQAQPSHYICFFFTSKDEFVC